MSATSSARPAHVVPSASPGPVTLLAPAPVAHPGQTAAASSTV